MPTLSQLNSRWRPAWRHGKLPSHRVHPLDILIALLTLRSRMFCRGWGDEALLAELEGKVSREDPPCPVSIEWHSSNGGKRRERRDGTFPSPLTSLPAEASTVHLRAWSREGNHNACVLLSGSHDEGYGVRERVFGGLVARGVDLYFVESPFYGRRRILGGISAIRVSDQALMALGMVLEARALLHALRGSYERLAIAGYSMGGHMAAITAAVSPFPVACAALATGASASSIYTRGLMSWGIDFDGLGGGPERRTQAQELLRNFFDAADITHYNSPIRTDAAVILGCTRDGYVMRSETERLHQHWPGSTLRWLSAGHFSALVSSRKRLCDCVVEAIEKL